MSARLRRAGVPADAAAIARIYNEGMADRVATFETEPRGAADIAPWFAQNYPVCVAGIDDRVLAYAAAFPYRARACYDGVREFSVYVARDGRGQGFGFEVMTDLIAESRARGWWKLLSRVFPSNTASLALCRKLGFREVGVYEKHGRLDGRWMDVVIVEKLLL